MVDRFRFKALMFLGLTRMDARVQCFCIFQFNVITDALTNARIPYRIEYFDNTPKGFYVFVDHKDHKEASDILANSWESTHESITSDKIS
ncbi:MAG: hypothetical protein CUR32_00970 [Flavobacterium sp.]|nr:MAG: hypothetical protein CUR32_00970 [Flavobacterium sp.] [Flavobacterium sp. FEMGT703F]